MTAIETTSIDPEILNNPIYRKRVDESYCERIARTFSRNYGIKVRFGALCMTDSKATIELPKMYAERWIVDGLLDHECGHVRREIKCKGAGCMTWEDLVPRIEEFQKIEKYKSIHMWSNVIQDISCETEDSARWPGVHENLIRKRTFLFEELEKKVSGVDEEIEVAPGLVFKIDSGAKLTFADALGKAFISIAMGPSLEDSKVEKLKIAADFVNEYLSEFIPRAKAVEWIDDGFALAVEICDKLADLKDEAEEAKKKAEDKGDEFGEGEPTEGLPGVPGDEDGPEGAGTPSDGSEASGDGSEASDGSPVKGLVFGTGDGEAASAFLEKMEELEGTVDEDSGTFEGEARKLADAETREVYCPSPEALARDKAIRPSKNKDTFREREAAGKKISSALAGKLRMILLSSRRSIEHGRRRGKLDAGSLHRVAKFDSRVFKRDVREEIGIDQTVVSILIDQSGSMGYGKMTQTVEAVIALATALNMIGIKFEVLGWTNSRASTGYGSKYQRTLPFVFSIFKTFEESWEMEKARLGSCHARAENADGEAVEWAARRLIARPESRKILFVMSDGMPACGADPRGAHIKHLHRIVDWVEKKTPVDVIGFGLRDEAVKRFYKRNVVVDNLSELPKKLFRELRKSIKGA